MPAHPPAIPLADRLTLTIQEAAQITGLRITLLREAISAGLLRSSKIGRRRYIRLEDLNKFICRGERTPLNVGAAYRAAKAKR